MKVPAAKHSAQLHGNFTCWLAPAARRSTTADDRLRRKVTTSQRVLLFEHCPFSRCDEPATCVAKRVSVLLQTDDKLRVVQPEYPPPVLHYRLHCAGKSFNSLASRAIRASDDNTLQQHTKGEKPILQAVTRHGLRKRMILVSPLFAMRQTAANRGSPSASSSLPQPALSLPPLLHVHALTEETRQQGVREYRPH
jgi:hypothetical protein